MIWPGEDRVLNNNLVKHFVFIFIWILTGLDGKNGFVDWYIDGFITLHQSILANFERLKTLVKSFNSTRVNNCVWFESLPCILGCDDVELKSEIENGRYIEIFGTFGIGSIAGFAFR